MRFAQWVALTRLGKSLRFNIPASRVFGRFVGTAFAFSIVHNTGMQFARITEEQNRRSNALLRSGFFGDRVDRGILGIWRRRFRGGGNCQDPLFHFPGDLCCHLGRASITRRDDSLVSARKALNPNFSSRWRNFMKLKYVLASIMVGLR